MLVGGFASPGFHCVSKFIKNDKGENNEDDAQ